MSRTDVVLSEETAAALLARLGWTTVEIPVSALGVFCPAPWTPEAVTKWISPDGVVGTLDPAEALRLAAGIGSRER